MQGTMPGARTISVVAATLGCVRVCAERLNCETPTLLHLAAKYALHQLADRLLDLPDSQHACRLANADGQRPCQLAAGAGHTDLASRLAPPPPTPTINVSLLINSAANCTAFSFLTSSRFRGGMHAVLSVF